MKTCLIILAVFSRAAFLVSAHEEMTMPLASADIRGISNIAGGTRIVINSPEGRIESARIWAFGKEFKIPEVELEKLKGHGYSFVTIQSESGTKVTGGPTVYFVLHLIGELDGDPSKGDPVKEQKLTILVQDNGSVTITEEMERLQNPPRSDTPVARDSNPVPNEAPK